MTHGYSLRPNAKGRRRHRGSDEADDQIEGISTSTSTSTSTSASTSSTSEGGQSLTDGELEGEPGSVDSRPTSPDTPMTAHNDSLAPTQDPKHQTIEEDHIITSSVTTSATTTATSTSTTTAKYRVLGSGRPQTWEDIQAARKREEARCNDQAIRIRRDQVVRGYEGELRALHTRIEALRLECEVKVEKVRRKWARARAVERGMMAAAAVVDEAGSRVGSGSYSNSASGCWKEEEEEADGKIMEMAVDKDYAPTETSSTSCWSHSESNFLPPAARAPAPLWKTQQQQPYMGPGTFPLSGMGMGMGVAGPSRLKKEEVDDDDDERGPLALAGLARETSHTQAGRQTMRYPTLNHLPSQGGRNSHSHSGRRPQQHPQPLERQSARLMAIPTTSSHGLHV